jgi:hypothetical protein
MLTQKGIREGLDVESPSFDASFHVFAILVTTLRPELHEAIEEFERQRARRDTLRRLLAEQRASVAGRIHRLLRALKRMVTGRQS